ncbi:MULTISPECIES: ubiquinol-cytochrome c reductase iron-sulfur subunit [unclassified Methyloversatilis]|jgi:ubiquinol-cytochrome c reductase iron-sulfur subunit|uniref:ubiquinol-cytochrome c reductase iron-sulfur subunit n=1 Tax=unclassified Methyloversatilis TaxID=2639971 RepID=UPI001A4CB0E1|nr:MULTISPECIES: ubiquinol-cytochrome c reductase iron-sulfur subunit [unclassified Methyloversatilis]MBL8475103.1 ubiquinol-cytochrome c reductase iron-sulfur subunit [Methyloversatilis sp.]MCQ9375660.1 ubiquinol-cytochrome c reductase iron-sulfur subunit [Methyloversatilis sp. XJ19-13]MCQ9379268.1 ubiquinol-cytochrome c reductase iron-sulfur subunit [Methyloversatilis sp. XJ19-49]
MSGNEKKMDCGRRNLLVATACAGGVAGLAVAVPFLTSLAPSERAKAAGAPVEVDVSKLAPGEMTTVEWQGKPVWILRRTPEQLEALTKIEEKLADPKSERNPSEFTPEYARNVQRAREDRAEFAVLVAICTHLGCSPSGPFASGSNAQLGDVAGFVCPCHGSSFDLAGRVFKAMPAPDNLAVPPYMFLSDSRILVGQDTKEG